MSPVVRAALVAPAVALAATGLAWLALGPAPALGVLLVGAAAIVGYHVFWLNRLAQWAASDLATPVPEAPGSWGIALSALHRRVRTRTAHQRDLAHTIERFRSAAEAIPDGMVVVDASDRIRWANTRGQAHFGIEPGRDVGTPLANLVRQPAFLRHLDAGDYSEALVIDSTRTPGLTLSIQIVPFGVDEKLLISRDVTRLEAVARMRRDFIANVSHELKTPLTVVTGFLETLQDVELDAARRRRYVELMSEQARSMERLVDDLLTLSALESEQHPPVEAPFPIAGLLDELAAAANALSNGRHAIALDADGPAIVEGGRDELASAFGNLVSNAVRYTPAGGTITLRWRVADDGTGEFSVADTGIGIGAEHVPRLTERFYRVDRSRSRATGGTGLGLAIVKHVLLRHQAELAIASEPGKGSTFTVRLPAARVLRAAPAPSRGADPVSAAGD
jgi:two-component system phosphate regulon sensor histidine kinase PhoR